MSWVEQLKENLPEYAKDIKLNLDSVINRSTIDPDHATYLALAAAFSTGNGKLVAFITASATDENNDPMTYTWEQFCLLYTSPSPRDGLLYRMPSSA